MDIAGTSAVVTGGASGLGLATASRLLDGGAAVVIADLPASDGEAVAKELGERASKDPAFERRLQRTFEEGAEYDSSSRAGDAAAFTDGLSDGPTPTESRQRADSMDSLSSEDGKRWVQLQQNHEVRPEAKDVAHAMRGTKASNFFWRRATKYMLTSLYGMEACPDGSGVLVRALVTDFCTREDYEAYIKNPPQGMTRDQGGAFIKLPVIFEMRSSGTPKRMGELAHARLLARSASSADLRAWVRVAGVQLNVRKFTHSKLLKLWNAIYKMWREHVQKTMRIEVDETADCAACRKWAVVCRPPMEGIMYVCRRCTENYVIPTIQTNKDKPKAVVVQAVNDVLKGVKFQLTAQQQWYKADEDDAETDKAFYRRWGTVGEAFHISLALADTNARTTVALTRPITRQKLVNCCNRNFSFATAAGAPAGSKLYFGQDTTFIAATGRIITDADFDSPGVIKRLEKQTIKVARPEGGMATCYAGLNSHSRPGYFTATEDAPEH